MSYGVYGKGQQITVLRRRPKTGPAAYDDYGNVQYQVSSTIVRGVAIWPTSLTEAESAGAHQRTTSYYTAALPLEVEVDNIDAVRWRDRDFEVSGEPSHYVSPHTGSGYQTINLRRVEG